MVKSFEPTYKELKLGLGQGIILQFGKFRAYLQGIETGLGWIWLWAWVCVSSLPTRNWNDDRQAGRWVGGYPFRAYLQGIETRIRWISNERSIMFRAYLQGIET